MIEALFVIACYAAFWSNMGGAASLVRPMIFGCLFLAALLAVANNRIRRIAPSPFELLLYIIALLSAAVSLVKAANYSIYYTMYFLAVLTFASVITRALSLEKLLDLSALVILLCVITCLLVSGQNLVAALKVSMGPNGMERFTPLGNHALLTGFIFGSGSLLLARRAYLAEGRLERYAMIGGALLSWIFLMAASARSSLVALMVATAFALFVELHLLRRLSSKRLALLAGIVVILAVMYFGFAGSYISDILQLNSAYRGVGTGATGRTDLWMRGVQTLVSDPALAAFGGGLRSSDEEIIGFFVENSYLTTLLDSGIFAGFAMILCLFYSPIQALRLPRSSASGGRNSLMFLPSFLVFPLVQCFYIRNYVGIGNPISLLILFMLMSVSMRAGFLVAPESAEWKVSLRTHTPSSLRTKS